MQYTMPIVVALNTLFLYPSFAAAAVTQAVAPAVGALCKPGNNDLKSDFAAAVAATYGAASAAELTPLGDPIVVFATPVSPDVDPTSLKDWNVCLPVSKSPSAGATLINNVVYSTLPPVTVLKESCAATDAAKAACATALQSAVSGQHLKIVRYWQLVQQPDGTVTVSLAVNIPVPPQP